MDVIRDIDATVEGLRPYLIHGERHVVVYYTAETDRDTILHCQLSADAIPAGLRVGDEIVVHVVMGVAAGITRRHAT